MSDLKTDRELGRLVHEHLVHKGLESPVTASNWLDADLERKKAIIAHRFRDIMRTLELNLNDDSLQDTPQRVAQMYVDEIFSGLNYNNFPKCTRIENKMTRGNNFLLERNISVKSACEHHFVVIDGVAHVAYIPGTYVIGLSKLNRIVDFFSRRPQVQERLTEQIAETISFITESSHVMVQINAVHYCVKARGVRDTTSTTSTIAARGLFSDMSSPLRQEFFASVER